MSTTPAASDKKVESKRPNSATGPSTITAEVAPMDATKRTKLTELAETWQKKGRFNSFQTTVFKSAIADGDAGLVVALDTFPKDDQVNQLFDAVKNALLVRLEKVWDDIFALCSTADGKKISKDERAALNISKASLVYGEVSFKSLAEVMWGDVIELKSGGVFYDLGSGTGRGVFTASLINDWSKLQGVEILEGLYQAGVDVQARYERDFKASRTDAEKKQHISFVHGSFLEVDWSDGDLVFANSTCFDEELMNEIAKQASTLKDGAFVVTLTKSLKADYLQLLYSKQHTMSWGYATVHIHKKVVPIPTGTPSPSPVVPSTPGLD